ncbi:MAG: hypothetical protein AAF565_02715 [Pseudomonadota bacterium]
MARDAQAQLGFDGLLANAETENRARIVARETAHLPGTLHVGVPAFAQMMEPHHAAMLAADVEETMRRRKDAQRMAVKINKGRLGILAGDDASGCVLARETAAAPGTLLLWGQKGWFEIAVSGCPVRIEMEGIFGIGSAFGYWPGFSAHVVDQDRPFISETGYRRFLGIGGDPVPGLIPETFATAVNERYVATDLKGKLRNICRSLSRDDTE